VEGRKRRKERSETETKDERKEDYNGRKDGRLHRKERKERQVMYDGRK
jgi:hypothetical protein